VKIPLSSLPLKAQIELEVRRRVTASRDIGSANTGKVDYKNYQCDPAAFGREILGEDYTDDVVEVMNSVRDNPVTIARSANAVGKTHGAARIAIWFYKCFPGAQVYTTAAPPEGNLRRILWGEIGSLVNKHPLLFAGDRTNTLNISRSPQEFVTGVTIPMAGTPEQREAKFNGKHAPNLLFIVDEGDAVPPEVYRGIEACMSGGNAHLLIMFNPRGANGPVYKMERDHQAKIVTLTAFRHPNVITGQDVFKGAVSQEKTVRRLNEWSRPLIAGEIPDAECFEVPEFLVGAVASSLDGTKFPPLPAGYRKITNPALYYMVLALYPAQSETQLISRSWIEAAVSRWHTYVATYGEIPPPATLPIVGLDVAEFGRDANVYLPRYGGWVPRIRNVWVGLDPDATAVKAAALAVRDEAINVLVDATGVGSGVAPRMERLEVQAESVKVASRPTYETEEGQFMILRDQLWWTVREWLRTDPGAMLPPDDELIEELAIPTYQVQGEYIRVMQKDTMKELLGRSPNKADALCLTFAPEGEIIGEYDDNPLTGYRG
jgi:phage terminase large subunit